MRTRVTGRPRVPRAVHPGAWWIWATAIAAGASRTTNPVVLALALAAVGYTATARRAKTPWSRSFAVFLRIGLVLVVIRVVLFALLAPAGGDHVLVRVPQVHLPAWLAGLRLGGPIAAEGVLASAYDGLRLAVVFACIGAANSVTSPRRMVKSLPAAWYEISVALTVAVAFVPQTVMALGRVRDARRLRGHRDRGVRGLRASALAVLEGALERSVDLAAAMEARGFGRRPAAERARATVGALTVIGYGLMLASSYGLFDRSAPAVTGLPMLVFGACVTTWAVVIGRRRGGRSHYRGDRWGLTEWLVSGCGVAAAVAFGLLHPDGPGTALQPLATPPLPWPALVATAFALLPAWLTPPVGSRPAAVSRPVAAAPTAHAEAAA